MGNGLKQAWSVLVCASIISVCAALPVLASVNFDGQLDFTPTGEWGAPAISALQDNYTGFGDQQPGGFSGGSELDQLFVKADGTTSTLYLGVTGNLEQNGNVILILLDTVPGGQNVLTGVNTLPNPPGGISNMEGSTLEAGFFADYALEFNCSGGNTFVEWYDLTAAPTATYLGQVQLNGGSSTLTGGTANGINIAFDDTNVVGVTGADATNAATATTGIEAAIPFANLGLTLPTTIQVQALVLSNSGYLSNQSLPPLPNGTPNLAFAPVNFQNINDSQAASVALTSEAWTGVLDGKSIPTDFGATDLAATQANPTGFGDQQGGALTGGSELDRLVAQVDDTTTFLDVGIAGNLNPIGQRLVIFLDTIPDAGQTLMANNPDDLAGMNGDTLPCPADYALVVNIFGGTLYANLFDLNALTNTYLGYEPANGTSTGSLAGGAAGPDWIIAFNNNNIAGVDANPADDPQTANAATAITGYEFQIPLSAIGSPGNGQSIGIITMVVGENGDRYVSNQLLPAGLGGGKPNLATNVDIGALGYTCATMPVGAPPLQCNTPRFDINGDSYVDMRDFGAFQACFTGTGGGHPPLPDECKCFDWDASGVRNGDIDEADLAIFIRCFQTSGPNVPADPNCDHPAPPT